MVVIYYVRARGRDQRINEVIKITLDMFSHVTGNLPASEKLQLKSRTVSSTLKLKELPNGSKGNLVLGLYFMLNCKTDGREIAVKLLTTDNFFLSIRMICGWFVILHMEVDSKGSAKGGETSTRKDVMGGHSIASAQAHDF